MLEKLSNRNCLVYNIAVLKSYKEWFHWYHFSPDVYYWGIFCGGKELDYKGLVRDLLRNIMIICMYTQFWNVLYTMLADEFIEPGCGERISERNLDQSYP